MQKETKSAVGELVNGVVAVGAIRGRSYLRNTLAAQALSPKPQNNSWSTIIHEKHSRVLKTLAASIAVSNTSSIPKFVLKVS